MFLYTVQLWYFKRQKWEILRDLKHLEGFSFISNSISNDNFNKTLLIVFSKPAVPWIFLMALSLPHYILHLNSVVSLLLAVKTYKHVIEFQVKSIGVLQPEFSDFEFHRCLVFAVVVPKTLFGKTQSVFMQEFHFWFAFSHWPHRNALSICCAYQLRDSVAWIKLPRFGPVEDIEETFLRKHFEQTCGLQKTHVKPLHENIKNKSNYKDGCIK